MRCLFILFFLVRIHAYEFVSNEQLVNDLQSEASSESDSMDLVNYVKENIEDLPRISANASPEETIPLYLNYYVAVNKEFQANIYPQSQNGNSLKKFPIFLVSMLQVMARAQPDVKKFLAAIPKSDKTYRVRLDGFNKMNEGIVMQFTAIGIMTGESRIDDNSKLYLLTQLKLLLPQYKVNLSKEMMRTPKLLFERYDVTDQSDEVKGAFLSIKDIINEW
jgi:hypothetical protein